MKRRPVWLAAAIVLSSVIGLAVFDFICVQPATSQRFQAWHDRRGPPEQQGAGHFSYGDFGALDLDTLETSAVPWVLVAASLALKETNGKAEAVTWKHVHQSFKRFGFLFPKSVAGLQGRVPEHGAPYGLNVGMVGRTLLPLRIRTLNVGCAACHAGPSYGSDGSPDPTHAIPGTPNSGLDLEAFTLESYRALKASISDEVRLWSAIDRLFPEMGTLERQSLKWFALPTAKSKLKELELGLDRPLPFFNGAPGLTNGVSAIKNMLGLSDPAKLDTRTGFVSIPALNDRFFRSAVLVDGAYTVKGSKRFTPKSRAAAKETPARPLAEIASLFLVPSMGLSPERAADAIPVLIDVAEYLRDLAPPRFPGPIDLALASRGRTVYDRSCAECHGTYDESRDRPKLISFPNWAGDVGSDDTRRKAFSDKLKLAIGKTLHSRKFLDVEATGQLAAPLLSGLWASAPYFANGSVPTVRHILEPKSRPKMFVTGGHALDFENLGVKLVTDASGFAVFPARYRPYSAPVRIDTSRPGFSNHGHEDQVSGLTAEERDGLLEFLKLL